MHSLRSILVSGGAGFIGSHLVDKLLSTTSSDIVVVDNLSTGLRENIPSIDRVKFIECDVSDINTLYSCLKDYEYDVIYHLAAITSLDEAYEDPYKTFTTNVLGTLNLLELSRRLDIPVFIYSSSVAVYGEPKYLPIDEDHPLKPINFYGYTKLRGEELVREYSNIYGFRYVILRYFNVYGPRMRSGQYSGVVHKFITSLLNNVSPKIFGDGHQTRDFIYVDDVVEANIMASKKPGNYTLNIGTGVETRIIDLLNTLKKILGKFNVMPEYLPKRPGDVYRSLSDSSRAYEVLGWRANTTLNDGLSRCVNWYLERYGLNP